MVKQLEFFEEVNRRIEKLDTVDVVYLDFQAFDSASEGATHEVAKENESPCY